MAGKYVDDELRIPLIQRAFYKIDQMDTDMDTKQILKTGIGLGNIDYLGKMAKNEEFASKNRDMIDSTINMIYKTQEANAKSVNSGMIDMKDRGIPDLD